MSGNHTKSKVSAHSIPSGLSTLLRRPFKAFKVLCNGSTPRFIVVGISLTAVNSTMERGETSTQIYRKSLPALITPIAIAISASFTGESTLHSLLEIFGRQLNMILLHRLDAVVVSVLSFAWLHVKNTF